MPILKVPMIVLEDTSAASFDLNVRVVDPFDAAHWIAHGTFEQPDPIKNKPWFHYALNLDYEAGGWSARLDLGCELIAEAVQDGRLQCVYVVEDGNHRRLEAASAEVLAMPHVECSWEDGFRLTAGNGTDANDDRQQFYEVADFLLLWNEAKLLRPGGKDPAVEGVGFGGSAASAPDNSRAISRTLEAMAVGTRHTPQVRAGNRGRPAGKHGAPIAAFVLDLINIGDLAGIATEKDDALGARLSTQYVLQGLTPPSPRNAASDARGAVDQIMKMRGIA